MNKISSRPIFSIFALWALFSLAICQPPQLGSGPMELVLSSNWGTGLCGTLKMTNPSSSTAKSSIISMKICNGHVTSSWSIGSAFKAVMTSQDSTVETWQFQSEQQNIAPGAINSDISFCMSNTELFDVSVSLLLGSDLFAEPVVGCVGLECGLSCGDGLCSRTENITGNCPIDCQPNQCAIRQGTAGGNVWLGVGSLVVTQPIPYAGSSWLCGDVFVRNPSTSSIAVSHVLSLQVCTQRGAITSFWGYDQQMVSYNTVTNTFRQVATNVIYQPGQTYNVGGLCMYLTPAFDMTKHLRFAVELSDSKVTCNSQTCTVGCGDGTCQSSSENSSSCPADCNPVQC